MAEIIVVGISDMKVMKGDGMLSTYALSSCIATCIYDDLLKIGGMSHILLPKYPHNIEKNNIEIYKYANTAIIEMVKEMERMGSSRYRMRAKIAGGAHMKSVFNKNIENSNIGEQNIREVKSVLQSLYIPVVSENVGENYARSVFFDIVTGNVKVKIANKTEIYI